MIITSNYVSNFHVNFVYYNSKIVGRRVIRPNNDQIIQF